MFTKHELSSFSWNVRGIHRRRRRRCIHLLVSMGHIT